MNELQNFKENVTMTSIEIAELTGKEHRNVLRDVDEQLSKICSLLRFEQSYIADNGQSYKMYRLPRRETLILISGYSVELRARIVDRLNELEEVAKYGKALPRNFLSALKALIVSEEEKTILAIENAQMQPKAEYFDTLVDRNLLTSLRDTAKELGLKERQFIKFLLDNYYLYRDQKGKLMPYAKNVEGYFEVKECVSDKTEWSGLQTLVTPKGRGFFISILAKKQTPTLVM